MQAAPCHRAGGWQLAAGGRRRAGRRTCRRQDPLPPYPDLQVVCWLRPALLVHLLGLGYAVLSTGGAPAGCHLAPAGASWCCLAQPPPRWLLPCCCLPRCCCLAAATAAAPHTRVPRTALHPATPHHYAASRRHRSLASPPSLTFFCLPSLLFSLSSRRQRHCVLCEAGVAVVPAVHRGGGRRRRLPGRGARWAFIPSFLSFPFFPFCLACFLARWAPGGGERMRKPAPASSCCIRL